MAVDGTVTRAWRDGVREGWISPELSGGCERDGQAAGICGQGDQEAPQEAPAASPKEKTSLLKITVFRSDG